MTTASRKWRRGTWLEILPPREERVASRPVGRFTRDFVTRAARQAALGRRIDPFPPSSAAKRTGDFDAGRELFEFNLPRDPPAVSSTSFESNDPRTGERRDGGKGENGGVGIGINWRGGP